MKLSVYLDKLISEGFMDNRKMYTYASTATSKTGAWGFFGAIGGAIAAATADTQGLPRVVLITIKDKELYILSFKGKKSTKIVSIIELGKVFFISEKKGLTESKVVLSLDGVQYNFFLTGKNKKNMDGIIEYLETYKKNQIYE